MIKDFFGLVRFSHTIFALPFALASMFLASQGFPGFKVFLLILLAMITARNSAMAFNRLVDRNLDGQNPRTKERHLPAGKLAPKSVVGFIVINSFFFVFISFCLNSLAGWLSPLALILIFLYSFLKRWTSFCHLYLGLCLAIAPMGAWVAVQGSFGSVPLWIGLIVLLWVGGFDVIYSTLDAEFDKKVGLFSIPSKWGVKSALRLALLLHSGVVLLLFAFGAILNFGWIYFFGVSLITLLIGWEHKLSQRQDSQSINKAFFNMNAIVSFLFLFVIMIEVFVV